MESSEGIDHVIGQFTDILTEAGSSHIREISVGRESNMDNNFKGAKWYDQECKKQREKFGEYELRYYETGEESDRIIMCEERNIYRKMCREKRDFNQKEADSLVLLSKKDPKGFWYEIKGNENKEKKRRL